MIAAPVFFSRSEWVAPPADWAKTGIQQGKTYSLAEGEGRRLLEECTSRATAAGTYWNVDKIALGRIADGPRYGSPLLIQPRLGQGLFSLAVRDAYHGACAVTRALDPCP